MSRPRYAVVVPAALSGRVDDEVYVGREETRTEYGITYTVIVAQLVGQDALGADDVAKRLDATEAP